MSGQIFTNGFSLMIMLSIRKREMATVAEIQADILQKTTKDIKQSAISTSLNNLVKRGFISRSKVDRKGELSSGQHGCVFKYTLTKPGFDNSKWMVKSICLLK